MMLVICRSRDRRLYAVDSTAIKLMEGFGRR